jgi:stage III sporulation protein AD
LEILQIVGLGLIATILIVLVKEGDSKAAGILISVAAGVTIFLFVLPKISAVINLLKDLANKANINTFFLAVILKIIGIAYIAEFGSQLCRDTGEGSIAAKIEFAAKIFIMVLAIPIIASILETIMKLLP